MRQQKTSYPQPNDDAREATSDDSGGVHAFERVYRENVQQLTRFVAMRISSMEDAQDIVAETTVQTMAYLRSSDIPVANPRALFYKIARNRIADYHERRSNHREVSMDADEAHRIPASTSLAREVELRDDIRDTLDALERIHDDYREVLLLSVNAELSISEIAELMERNRGAIRVLLFRARRALAAALRERPEGTMRLHPANDHKPS